MFMGANNENMIMGTNNEMTGKIYKNEYVWYYQTVIELQYRVVHLGLVTDH